MVVGCNIKRSQAIILTHSQLFSIILNYSQLLQPEDLQAFGREGLALSGRLGFILIMIIIDFGTCRTRSLRRSK